MIGYMCKYAPIEILEACGAETALITPHVNEFPLAETLLHNNVCSFTKAVLEEFEKGDYGGLLLTSCCDSVRRLYDVLHERFPDRFIYCVDLPRKVNDFTVSLYEQEIKNLMEAYSDFSGQAFDPDLLYELCRRKREAARIDGLALKSRQKETGPVLALAGARCNNSIRNLLADHGVTLAYDLTCTATDRSYRLGKDAPLSSYSFSLLNQVPCLRMVKATGRERILDLIADHADGLIYHTVQFCDIYSYEYVKIRDTRNIPILKLETDSTESSGGQVLTRIEAFLESISKGQAGSAADRKKKISTTQRGSNMYVLGIDSGSTSTNAVLLNQEKQIVAWRVLRTGAKSANSADRILEDIIESAGIVREDIKNILSTGYGRVSIPYADRSVTEISCHAKGAHFLHPSTRTILDIGGQDSKAIRITENGDVADFVMNDKCAAGTGRFLEMMARTLEIDIESLGPLSLKWKEPIKISSMCSVFAESEVISLIAQNKETADIAHGIHEAIVSRAVSLMKRTGLSADYMMTGGVAKNPGVVEELKSQLNAPVFVYEEPEIVGALGAALFALEDVM